MDTLELTWKFNFGEKGVDSDPSNPLSRALDLPLEKGKPYEAHSLCFYGDKQRGLRSHSISRWLGVFLLSAGGRIIIFPGLSMRIEWIQTTSGTTTEPRHEIVIDHVTIEPKTQSWHFTAPNSHGHYVGGRTPDIGGGRLLCFGLSLDSEQVLPPVRTSTIVACSSPPSDADRRLQLLLDAQKKASSHMIVVTDDSRSRFNPGFLHFTFMVAPQGTQDCAVPFRLLPYGSPSLQKPLPATIPDLQIGLHCVPLASVYDVQIACMWLPGGLSVPAVWTSVGHL